MFDIMYFILDMMLIISYIKASIEEVKCRTEKKPLGYR
jgi:hypothetical protein